jgi:excinuclease ABC subunit C
MFGFDAKHYPQRPGCYLMKDAQGYILYVGKSKNLRRRLSSYFGSRKKGWRTRRLVARVAEIEVIIVNNEVESLVLENNLVKHHQPRFNRMLMGDATGYPYIVLTEEEYPRFFAYKVGRVNRELEGAQVSAIALRFGPYVSSRFRDTLLDYVNDTFRIRTCLTMPDRACLRYHIARCDGICERKVSADAYAEAVEQAVTFLSRQHTDLIRQMKNQMTAYAERLDFERASRIKKQLEALEVTLEKQIVERDVDIDQDVIYFGERKALVMHIKRGAVLGLELLDLDLTTDYTEACERFILSHYRQDSPDGLIVSELRDPRRVEQLFTAACQRSISVRLANSGVDGELMQLCKQNYAYRTSGKASDGY